MLYSELTREQYACVRIYECFTAELARRQPTCVRNAWDAGKDIDHEISNTYKDSKIKSPLTK